ncbi:ABC transporter substrate-binding protein, partial [Candidatus Thioglobus sp.]|nr:ABC transporter substrate-binding protein [Candidatus Thioglobus sp.]
SQIENMAKVKVSVSLEDEVGNTTVTLKLIRSNRWKIYDLDYQTISIVGMEKMGYDSKIKRLGIEKLIQKMLNKS